MDNCPHCNTSLIGEEIPKDLQDAGYCGDSTHWRRETGIEVPEVYDGVIMFRCPDCDKYWARFPWVKIDPDTGTILEVK